MLQSSGITKDKVMENPDAVLDVLNFHEQYTKQTEQQVAKIPLPATHPKPVAPPPTQPAQHHAQDDNHEEHTHSTELPEEKSGTLSMCTFFFVSHILLSHLRIFFYRLMCFFKPFFVSSPFSPSGFARSSSLALWFLLFPHFSFRFRFLPFLLQLF